MIAEANTRQPIGMVVGGDDRFVYGCRFSRVLTLLQVALKTA